MNSFVALLMPFSRANALMTSHSSSVLVAIWSLGLIYAIVGSFGTQVVTNEWHNETTAICRQHVIDGPLFARIFSFCNFVLTYALPLTVMSVLYTILILKLRKRPRISSSQNHFNSDSSTRSTSHDKVCMTVTCGHSLFPQTVRMLVVVVISFVVCMSPSKLLAFVNLYRPQSFAWFFCYDYNLTVWVKLLFNWLLTMHSVVNPVIYSFLCNNFRVNLFLLATKVLGCLAKNCSYDLLRPHHVTFH